MTLHYSGKVPSIKNRKQIVRNRKTGVSFIKSDKASEAQLNAMIAAFQTQWPDEPVEHPDMTVRFYVTAQRADRDNMLNAVMDALVRAGVLVNDNIKRCNGRLVVESAEVGDREGVEVDLA